MSRFRVGVAGMAMIVSLLAIPVVVTAGGGVADAAALGPCTGTQTGSTFTLTANCDTTVSISIPDGVTLNGAGHTITAHDPSGGNFLGAVLINAGTSMSIENLTIDGTGFATDCGSALKGIFFNDASGSVSGVHIENITQHNGCAGTGIALRANGVAAARTVTITNAVVTGYQKSALIAAGSMTMNVSGSTLGPPDNLKTIITQNGVQYSNNAPGSTAAAGGTITDSTIYGSGFGKPSNDSTAALLFGAKDVTLSGDTLTGAETDVGVAVVSGSTGITLKYNKIGRTSPDSPDTFGLGVKVDTTSTATLICNTFTGWTTDITGATQALCVVTTSVPAGIACHAYPSTTLAATSGTTPYKWSLSSGSLPAGLTLSPAGVMSGTPTKAGTFSFTVKVTDSSSPPATAIQTLTITVAAGCPSNTTPTTRTAPTAPITNAAVPVTG